MSYRYEVEFPEDIQDMLIRDIIRILYGEDNIFAHEKNILKRANDRYNRAGIYFSKKQVIGCLERLESNREVISEMKSFEKQKPPLKTYRIAKKT